MTTPASVLMEVAGIGGRLAIAGDRIRTLLPANCQPELKDQIRAHKIALLILLRLNFVLVKSDVLRGETVVFADSEATKTALVAAGADPGIVYSPEELRVLVSQRCGMTDLLLAHVAKRTSHGRIVPKP